jgi:PAS domain S-box-containing protein
MWTNPAVQRVTGYTVKELMAMADYPQRLGDEQDRERVGRAFRSALRGSTGNDVGLRIERKDGTVIQAEMSWQPIHDEKGVCLGHRESIRDVTEQKEAEEAVRRSEEKYRELVETMNEGMGVADEHYTFTYVNNKFCEMLGYSADEMIGHHLTEFLDEQNRQVMEGQIARRRQGEAESFDLTWTAKDGQKVYTIASPKGIFDSEGNFRGSFGVLTDITDRKLAEEALSKAEQEKEAILDSLAELVVYENRDMTILWANRAACESVGMAREQLIGRACYKFWGSGNQVCKDCPVTRAMETGQTQQHERKTADGRAWLVQGSPVRSEAGEIIGGVDIALDITDRKRAEEALRESEEKYRKLAEGRPGD